MVHSTPLQDSQIRHHASSLGQIVIKAFAFQGFTERMDGILFPALPPSLGVRNAGYAGLKLGEAKFVVTLGISFLASTKR